MVHEVTCDICRKLFDADRRRWFCDKCSKYFYVCPADSKRQRIPCPHCGTGLRKKSEPIKKN